MPAGIAVTGAACGAGLVQPAPARVAGAELAAGTPAVQPGGTDSWPSEDAWPTPASTGDPTPLVAAVAAGAVGMNGADSAPGAVGSQLTAPGRNCPWPRAMKSDAAAPVFWTQLNGVPKVANDEPRPPPPCAGVAALSAPDDDVDAAAT